MNKRELLGGTLAGMMFLSGCSAAIETRTTPVVETVPTTAPTPAQTATEAPTPRAETIYTAEALSFIPHSVEEIDRTPEVRSPIDDPEGYKEDIAKVLAVIHNDILPNYTGEFITGDKQQISVQTERGMVRFQNGLLLDPIAADHFKWIDSSGQTFEVPEYFFPAMDNQGKIVLSMVFSPTRVNPPGAVDNDNPAPNWTMPELLKRFPMQLKGGGAFDAIYFNSIDKSDEFTAAFYKANNSKDENGNSKLAQAFFDFIYSKPFDRSMEGEPLVAHGGQ